MSEATKPRPLGEHLQRAREIHDRLTTFARDARGVADLEDKLAQLRESAGKGYWLYPVIEAIRGVPR